MSATPPGPPILWALRLTTLGLSVVSVCIPFEKSHNRWFAICVSRSF